MNVSAVVVMNKRRIGVPKGIAHSGHNVRVLGRLEQFWERCVGLAAFAGCRAPEVLKDW